MPKNYSNLSRGEAKSTPARKKYVRSYLKGKGVTPTKDASMRSTRERKLRAKARAEFAAQGKKAAVGPRTSGISIDRRNQGGPKVDRAERARQERMRPNMDREAQRQLKGRSQNKNYVRGKNR